jgi:hypothetical protein
MVTWWPKYATIQYTSNIFIHVLKGHYPIGEINENKT